MNSLLIPVLSVIGGATAIGAVLNIITGIVRKPDPEKYWQTWIKLGILLGLIFVLLVAGAWGQWSFLPVVLLLGYLSWQELIQAVQKKYDVIQLPIVLLGCGLAGILAGLLNTPLGLLTGIMTSLWASVILPVLILRRPIPLHHLFTTTFGICFLSLPLACFLSLVNVSYGAFTFLVIVSMANDGFSEGIGRFLGRTKLCPDISPGKTVEGAIGGFVSALCLGYALRDWVPELSLNCILLLAGGISGFSLIGDLLFSAIKREVGIKDFGQTLAVTGGILDKFDGLMLTIPVFFVVIQWFGA